MLYWWLLQLFAKNWRLKIVEFWDPDSAAEYLPTGWGPFACCLHSALYPSVFIFPYLLSQSTQLWPMSLTICSCSCNLLLEFQLFFIFPLLLSLTTWLILLFVSIDSSFLDLISLFSVLWFLQIQMYIQDKPWLLFVAWFKESTWGTQTPSLFLMPFRPWWLLPSTATGGGVFIPTWCQVLSFFLLPHHFTCKLQTFLQSAEITLVF